MPEKPNLLLITTDQQRGDCVGYDGHPCVRTPHLDMLARESTVFSQAHVDCPVCIPARTTLVTGVESHHYGCPDFAPGFRVDRERKKFLGSLLTSAGYQTCLIGKSHWHTDPSFGAGFEQWFRWTRWERDVLRDVGSVPTPGIGVNELSASLSNLPPHLQKTTWSISEALGFLEDRDRSRPFCLWVSLIDPHPENIIHEPYYSMYDHDEVPEPVLPEWVQGKRPPLAIQRLRGGNDHAGPTRGSIRKSRGVYYGMVTHIDHQLGRLFGGLMRNGLWDNTAILYSSDHGEQLFDHGFCFKGNFLDPSARVPLLIRLPSGMEVPRGVSSSALVQWADLLPTLCDLSGIRSPDDIDGASLLPLLRGECSQVRDFLHGQIGKQHMFHDGTHKYLYFVEDGRELVFDKTRDRLDENDLSGEAGLVDELRNRFISHLRDEEHPHLDGEGNCINEGLSFSGEENLSRLGWMGLGATR